LHARRIDTFRSRERNCNQAGQGVAGVFFIPLKKRLTIR
jgi:hypothetical protein